MTQTTLHSFMDLFLSESIQKLDSEPYKSSRVHFLEFLMKYFGERKTTQYVMEDLMVSLKKRCVESSRSSYMKKILLGEVDERLYSEAVPEKKRMFIIKNYILEYEGLHILKDLYDVLLDKHPQIRDEGTFLSSCFSEKSLLMREEAADVFKTFLKQQCKFQSQLLN